MEYNLEAIDNLRLLAIHAGLATHYADWNWKNVSSPFTRLYYVTKGTANVILPDGILRLSPGNMYLVPAFARHSNECHGEFEHYYIHIYEELHSNSGFLDYFLFPHEIPAGDYELYLFRRLCEINPSIRLHNSDPSSYDSYNNLIKYIAQTRHGDMSDRVESRGILYQLMARFFKLAKPKYAVRDSRIKKSLEYINTNLQKNIRVDDLSGILCLSRDHFIRLFKNEMGVTPVQYINGKKIEKAQLLLVTENMSIKEIAYMLSFEDNSYFNRLFKKIVGVTPLEYRKGMKGTLNGL